MQDNELLATKSRIIGMLENSSRKVEGNKKILYNFHETKSIN